MRHTPTISLLKQHKILLFAILIIITGCSLEKKSGLNRGLQNLTAKYNILFNANELLRQKQESYEAAYVDDYNELLSVFRDTVAKNDVPDVELDAVKAKANKIISVKEQSHYLGDAYLLLSKANFLDGNYFDAIEYANYVIRSFGNNPDLKQQALVYKARALLYINQRSEAKIPIDSALQNISPKKKITGDVYATKLQYDIDVQDYADAEEMARLAIQHSQTNDQKLRLTFILAQLQELNHKPAEAISNYDRVSKSNAIFDMAFNANLNKIRIEDGQNGVKISRLTRLRSLLKNSNNKDFTDQIYYQIAQLQYADGDIDNALKSYRLSINSSTKNVSQKGLSYLRMADVYFKDKADYAIAKKYYDSTLLNLSPGYPNYKIIKKKSDNLQLLADRLQTISREDTLQMLAKLDEAARLERIDKMVEAQIVKSQPSAVSIAQTRGMVNVNQLPMESTPTGDNFYFSNSNAISQGFASFKRIWGNRKLEDNWRRSNRASSDITQNTSASNQIIDPDSSDPVIVNSASAKVDASNYRQQLMQNLPLTPALMAQSNKRIFDTYLDIANFYRDVLEDKKEAILAYELLLIRFPDNDSNAAIYYNLYRLHSESSPAVSDKYKDLLVKNFPETPFAKTILDPDFSKRLSEENTGFSILYNKVYDLYAAKQYPQVISAADALLAQYPNNRFAAQLYYLRAFAAGHQEPLAPFNNSLLQIVSKYPEDKLITPLVNLHLAYITANKTELAARRVVLSGKDADDRYFTIPIVYQQQTEYRPPVQKYQAVADVRKPEPKVVAPPPAPIEKASAITSAPVKQEKVQEVKVVDDLQAATSVKETPQTSKTMAPVPVKQASSIFSMRDSTNYYFVVNVSTGTTNLSSSRFGIGQFNRVNFQDNTIKHQLKPVGADNQLIFVGRFTNLTSVKDYARAIIPLMPDIMKVSKDKYSFFIITQENLDKLADRKTLDNYIDYYQNNY